jgi:hypothetical protein
MDPWKGVPNPTTQGNKPSPTLAKPGQNHSASMSSPGSPTTTKPTTTKKPTIKK